MMNLTQLQYFRTLALSEHVTNAASTLHITQSTLSKAIASLEKELGYPLFEHRKGSIKLNARGRTFLKGVDEALNILDDSIRTVNEPFSLSSNELIIASPHPYSYNYVGNAIGEFMTNHPEMHIYNEVANSLNELIGKLSGGRIDCIIALKGLTVPENIAWHPLCTERLLLIAKSGQISPDESEVSIKSFSDYKYCLSSDGSDQRMLEESVLESAGIVPEVIYAGGDLPYVIEHMRMNNIVAFVPEAALNDIYNHEGINSFLLKEPYCRVTLGVYYQSENTNATLKKFVDFLDRRIGAFLRPLY